MKGKAARLISNFDHSVVMIGDLQSEKRSFFWISQNWTNKSGQSNSLNIIVESITIYTYSIEI